MRQKTLSLMSCLITLAVCQPASAADGLCESLRTFADSVKPGETKTLRFHTIWGSNFKDRDGKASGAKRCDYAGYEPAKPVCTHLMEYGAIQFSGYNAKATVQCLSKKTRFAADAEVQSMSVSLTYGAKHRGSRIAVELKEDIDLGGKVLTITATGFDRGT
jgi:hypothetical protein